MRTYASPPWQQTISINYLEFFFIEDCTSPHLSSYSLVLVSVWIHWDLFLAVVYIPKAYFKNFVAQILLILVIESLTFGPCVHLIYSYHCGIWGPLKITLSDTTRCSRLILHITSYRLRNSHVSKNSYFLLLE